VRRTRLLTHLEALRMLRPLDRGEALLPLHPGCGEGLALHSLRSERLALHPRRGIGLALHPRRAATAATTALESGLASATPMLTVRPRIRRGCDRQRGDAGCEKDPAHKISPLNGKNGPFGTPFQPLNGWNLHPTALG
jgi:hypothetical protein